MRPKEILQKWVEFFNLYDYERLADLYAEDCINRSKLSLTNIKSSRTSAFLNTAIIIKGNRLVKFTAYYIILNHFLNSSLLLLFSSDFNYPISPFFCVFRCGFFAFQDIDGLNVVGVHIF